MQAGFACCESGSARSKSACNIWLKNAVDFCVGALVFYFIGFGLMYGDDWHGLIGINGFLNPLDQDLAIWDGLGLSPQVYLLFQTMFCATTSTIISGSVAERFKFGTYIWVSVFMTGFVYPIVGHWIWGGGWLAQIGFSDFAGSTAVHSVGAWAALVCAALVGARAGKYTKDGKVKGIPGHNIPMLVLGVLILWVGWYGFNPGSELALDDTTFYTAVTTTFAAAAGGLGAMFTSWIRYQKPDVSLVANGCLGGLVAICTGVASVSYLGSIVIGLLAGILLVFAVSFFDRVLKIDDPVGAISIHGVCGIFGTACGGLFDMEQGLFYGGGASHLLHQCVGIAVVGAFVVTVVGVYVFILKRTMGIRISLEEELKGLDLVEHGMVAYPEFAGMGTSLPSVPITYINADAEGREIPPVAVSSESGKMYRVEIIANKSNFEELKDALNSIGIAGMTVSQVEGCGVQKGHKSYYRGAEVNMTLLPKVKVETVVSKVPVELVIETARSVLYSGHPGDGKIFIYEIDNAVRISSGETGVDALQYPDHK